MVSVGVRELRQKTSELIRRVREDGCEVRRVRSRSLQRTTKDRYYYIFITH